MLRTQDILRCFCTSVHASKEHVLIVFWSVVGYTYSVASQGNCPAGQSLIADIIDFDQEDDNMMIHYNICSQLDDLKISYHGLPSLLTKIVERELQVPPTLTVWRAACYTPGHYAAHTKCCYKGV